MERKPTLNPLLVTKTARHGERFDGFKEGEDEQPLSPLARLFHEPGANLYVIVIMGAKGVINPDVVKEKLADTMVKNKRFTSLQVLDKETGKMVWVPTNFNIDNHIIVPKLEPTIGSSSDKFVEDYISNLSRSGVDNSKPLWDLHILNTKTSDAQGTCVFRAHHSLGDGISLMNFLLVCSRKASDPEMLPTLPGNNMSHRQNKITSFRSLFIILWNSIVALVMFVLTVLFLKDSETPLKGSPGVEDRPRRFVTRSVSFDDIKLVKTAMDAGVSVVLMTYHVWSILTHRESLWVRWIHTYRLKGRSFWDVPLRGGMSWGWRKLLQIRDVIRPHIWYKIENGMKTSLWHDLWCTQSPLQQLVSNREITRHGLRLDNIVADLACNGQLRWPATLIISRPVFNQIMLPRLTDQEDKLVWKDQLGEFNAFSVSMAWETLRPRGRVVTWHGVV